MELLWQDLVLMVGCFGLGFALFPSIFSKAKPARSTCLMSAVILTAFAVAFATLGLWLSTAAQAFCTTVWYVLLFQRRS